MRLSELLSHEIGSRRNSLLVNLFLILLVIIPLLIIATLTVRSLHTESVIVEHQQQANHRWIIKTIDKDLQSFIEQKIESYFSELEYLIQSSSDFRGWVLNHIQIDLVAVYTLTGDRLYPLNNQNALVNELVFIQQIRSEVSQMFKQTEVTEHYRALIMDETGPKLFACNSIDQEIICILFNSNGLAEWVDQGLNSTTIPDSLQAKIIIPNLNGSPFGTAGKLDDHLTVLSTQQLSGMFDRWKIKLYGIPLPNSKNRYFLFALILLPASLLLIGCGYGLYRIEKLNSNQAREQKQFSAELAHEVRTPLANIRLYIELIKQASQQQQSQYCSILISEIERLSLLVDNAILLACPEQTLSKDELQLAEPDELIDSTLTTMAPLLTENNCDVTRKLDIGKALCFDQDALQRVLINLLDNARKYANGSSIEISSYLKDTNIVIELIDNGPGLPESLWSDLQQVDGKRINAGGKGFGLGLRVCLRLCRRSGGQLQNLASTQGTHYRISLPAIVMKEMTEHAYSDC